MLKTVENLGKLRNLAEVQKPGDLGSSLILEISSCIATAF